MHRKGFALFSLGASWAWVLFLVSPFGVGFGGNLGPKPTSGVSYPMPRSFWHAKLVRHLGLSPGLVWGLEALVLAEGK